MIQKIISNLEIPSLQETIRIEDIATKKEIETAKKIRKTQGKHVVPVPTFEIKKDFSGIMLDPLQIFRTKKDKNPYISPDRSIIRPTFSYLGTFTISDKVFRDIISFVASYTEGVVEITRLRVDKISYEEEGLKIYTEVTLHYGYNIPKTVEVLKNNIKKEMDRHTALNVLEVDVKVNAIIT